MTKQQKRIKQLIELMDKWQAKGKEHTKTFARFEIELNNLIFTLDEDIKKC